MLSALVALASARNPQPLFGVVVGGVVTALGIGWAGVGVLKLLNPPEAPLKPKEAQPQNKSTDEHKD